MYFNPQTEVVVLVDDSVELGSEVFNMEEFEGAEWVMISEETRSTRSRDELLLDFQTHYHPGDARSVSATANELEEEADDEDDDQEVGREDDRGNEAASPGRYAKPNTSARIT